MPFYRQMGEIPRKRHTIFRKEDGSLYREQVMGTKGFSGIQSILYHRNPPTRIVKSELLRDCRVQFEEQSDLCHRHFHSSQWTETGDAVSGRKYVMGNEDLLIGDRKSVV